MIPARNHQLFYSNIVYSVLHSCVQPSWRHGAVLPVPGGDRLQVRAVRAARLPRPPPLPHLPGAATSLYCAIRCNCQGECLPFTIESRPGKGNVVVATRDIRPSEVECCSHWKVGKVVDVSDVYLQVVLHDDAAVVGPNYETEAVCLECLGRVDGSVLCNLCNLPLCSEACQGGPNHLPECLVSN